MSSFFVSHFGKSPVSINHPFGVSMETEEALLVQLVFKSCVVSVNGMDTLVDLILLEMIEFDAIPGMDWLACCYATINYHAKVVKFEIPDGLSFIFRGDSYLIPVTLIFSLATLCLMDKGNMGFPTLVKNIDAEIPDLDQVAVVREFPDVFPTKFPGMPPEREIEFCVCLILDTQPIFIPPYHMAPAGLQELKGQLQAY